MSFARVDASGQERSTILDGDRLLDLRSIIVDLRSIFVDPSGESFAAGGVARATSARAQGWLPAPGPLGLLRHCALIARPSAIGIGMKYEDESGSERPSQPIHFLKRPNTVTGPNDVDDPHASTKTDWEVQLGGVIGSRASSLESPADSMPHVAGFIPVNDDASVRAAGDAVAAKFGRAHVVVNNAGIGTQGTVADHPDDEWARVFDINVIEMARISRAALPYLRCSPDEVIVRTASVAATAGRPQRALCSASMVAVLASTRAMAADHLTEGIRVSFVNPGTADTPWHTSPARVPGLAQANPSRPTGECRTCGSRTPTASRHA
jgi:NAD(P)-dependent dehydrogenase (short-subunit alcohol dehydrogenase family)